MSWPTANLPLLLWSPQSLRPTLLTAMVHRTGDVKPASPSWLKWHWRRRDWGDGFKYVVPHLGLLSNHALFDSQTKHRENTRTKEKALLMRVCEVSFLPIALLWWNLQLPFCAWWGFLPQPQILPKLPKLFFFQGNLLVSHFNLFFNKWSSLKLYLLQEQFWEKKMTLHTLKNPNLSDGMCRYHTMMLKWVLQIAERQNQQPPGLQGKTCLSVD